jgi:hypothetical protein
MSPGGIPPLIRPHGDPVAIELTAAIDGGAVLQARGRRIGRIA